MRCDKDLKRLKKGERDIPSHIQTYGVTHSPSTHLLVAAVAVIAITAHSSLLLRHGTAVEWRICVNVAERIFIHGGGFADVAEKRKGSHCSVVTCLAEKDRVG